MESYSVFLSSYQGYSILYPSEDTSTDYLNKNNRFLAIESAYIIRYNRKQRRKEAECNDETIDRNIGVLIQQLH
jgi:hypothetical protein